MNIRPESTSLRLIPALLLITAFGLAAGAVGTLLASSFLMPASYAPGTLLPARVQIPEQDAALAANPDRSAVLFFDAAPAADTPFASLVPTDAFGSGFVLTSDGWLLAHASSFPNGRSPLAAVAAVGGKTYQIKAAARDPFTSVLFLKIEASNLPVTAFGSLDGLPPGTAAFSFDAQGGIHRLTVSAYGDPAASAADLSSSSERLQQSVRLVDATGLLPGAMIVSRDGEVAAVYAGRDAAGPFAVPFDAFSGVIGGLLRDGKVSRPLLGVRYVDLSRLIGLKDAARGGRGALLSASSDGRSAAVLRGSPAGLAGLVASDVIMAVNGEAITAKTALSDLIAQYASGAAVTLTVAGQDGERQVVVTLGTVTP